MSWFLCKTPPLTVGFKQLATPVVSPSLEYTEFEGAITNRSGKRNAQIFDKGELGWLSGQNHRFFPFQGTKSLSIYTLTPFKENSLFYKVIEGELVYRFFQPRSRDSEVKHYS